MASLQVNYTKLVRYVERNPLYQLTKLGDEVELVFVPNFPEAEAHSGGETTLVVMHGRLSGGTLIFDSIKVETGGVSYEKDFEEASLTYSGWLQYVEENY